MTSLSSSEFDQFKSTGVCPNPTCASHFMRRRFNSEYAFEKHLSSPGSSACRQVVLDMMTHGSDDRKRGRVVDSNTVSHEQQPRPPPGYRPVATHQNEGLSVMTNTVDADPAMEDDEDDPPYPEADHADTEADPLVDVPIVAPVEEPVRPPTIVIDKMFLLLRQSRSVLPNSSTCLMICGLQLYGYKTVGYFSSSPLELDTEK